MELASDVEGLRLVLASTMAERYRVRVADDGGVVGLWREVTAQRITVEPMGKTVGPLPDLSQLQPPAEEAPAE